MRNSLCCKELRGKIGVQDRLLSAHLQDVVPRGNRRQMARLLVPNWAVVDSIPKIQSKHWPREARRGGAREIAPWLWYKGVKRVAVSENSDAEIDSAGGPRPSPCVWRASRSEGREG